MPAAKKRPTRKPNNNVHCVICGLKTPYSKTGRCRDHRIVPKRVKRVHIPCIDCGKVREILACQIAAGRTRCFPCQQRAKEGSANPNWKGGLRNKNEAIRRSPKYKLWRKTVFERDKYTCVHCGQRGGNLHADHIKPFAYFPDLRFDVNNGRTLCKSCHSKTDTYQSKVFRYRKKLAPLPLFEK